MLLALKHIRSLGQIFTNLRTKRKIKINQLQFWTHICKPYSLKNQQLIIWVSRRGSYIFIKKFNNTEVPFTDVIAMVGIEINNNKKELLFQWIRKRWSPWWFKRETPVKCYYRLSQKSDEFKVSNKVNVPIQRNWSIFFCHMKGDISYNSLGFYIYAVIYMTVKML